MASRQEAEADPGWPGLVSFLTVAGLDEAQLERALSLFAANEVSNVAFLRGSFSVLAPKVKAASRRLITDALASTLGAPQPSARRGQSSRRRRYRRWYSMWQCRSSTSRTPPCASRYQVRTTAASR